MRSTPRKVCSKFEEKFGRRPGFLVRAPGRVNLIGEHTDYNEGFVLPVAINRAVWIALQPRSDDQVRVYSMDFNESVEFSTNLTLEPGRHWSDYIKGITWALRQGGYPLHGWEAVMAGDVPIGAGLSSSAALEMAIAHAHSLVGGWSWQPVPMAKAGNLAEREWVGVRSGLMDQLVSSAAKEGNALFVDCRTLELEHIPLPAGLLVAILDTGTRRGLANSEYNLRSQQCQEAATRLGLNALRDADFQLLEDNKASLGDVLYRRAKHVVTENTRVLKFIDYLRHSRLEEAGELINDTHESLRVDFEVSSQPLDQMVACARQAPGCLGARLTGAGFAGCAMALIQEQAMEAFSGQVRQTYFKASGIQPELYFSTPQDGARQVTDLECYNS